MKEHGDQANGADEDGTTFPGLGKIDYVLTEATVWIIIISCKELPKRVMSQSSQIEVRVEIRWIVPRSAEAMP